MKVLICFTKKWPYVINTYKINNLNVILYSKVILRRLSFCLETMLLFFNLLASETFFILRQRQLFLRSAFVRESLFSVKSIIVMDRNHEFEIRWSIILFSINFYFYFFLQVMSRYLNRYLQWAILWIIIVWLTET